MHQPRALSTTLALMYAPVIGLLGAAVMVSLHTDTTLAEFTRDPAASTGAHPLLGVVSNIGLLCWCAAATMCFMGTAVLRRQGSDSPLHPFLLSAGLLTAALLLDDLFMLHDWFVVYDLRMDEKLLFGAYGAAVVAFLVYFRAVILASEFLLLGLALSFFAFSLAIDALAAETLPMQHLYEDGAKLFGIVSWLGYFGRASLEALAPASASAHLGAAACASDARSDRHARRLAWSPVVAAPRAVHANSPGSSRPGA
jgi:hypothetical protein